MTPDEREAWEDEPEAEDPAITRHLDELERQRAAAPVVRRRRTRKRKRSTTWIALTLLLASIYVFWVLPYQLGSRPVRIEYSRDKK